MNDSRRKKAYDQTRRTALSNGHIYLDFTPPDEDEATFGIGRDGNEFALVRDGRHEWLTEFDDPDVFEHNPDMEEIYFWRREREVRYGRSENAWRKPIMHVVRGYVKVRTDDSREPFCDSALWHCTGVVPSGKTRVVDELPTGFEVCQRCAEAMSFERRRVDERTMPDRGRYNADTQQMLDRAFRHEESVA